MKGTQHRKGSVWYVMDRTHLIMTIRRVRRLTPASASASEAFQMIDAKLSLKPFEVFRTFPGATLSVQNP